MIEFRNNIEILLTRIDDSLQLKLQIRYNEEQYLFKIMQIVKQIDL